MINVKLSLKQFEVLNDVLCEIEEFRCYFDDDLIALRELQDIFSYNNYKAEQSKSPN